MLKNKIQSYIDKENNCDKRRIIQKILGDKNSFEGSNEFVVPCNKLELTEGQSVDDYKDGLVTKAKDELGVTVNLPDTLLLSDEQKSLNNTLLIEKITNEIKTDAGTHLLAYIKKDYNDGRTEYYRLLDEVHGMYITVPFKSGEKIENKTLAAAICHALVFRAESYIAPFTVYHVVYQMQAPTEIPDLSPEAYKISLLEQLGYFMRFSFSHANDPNLGKKNAKYLSRLLSAHCKIGKGSDCGKFKGIKTMDELTQKIKKTKTMDELKQTVKKIGGRKNRRTRRKRKISSRRKKSKQSKRSK